MIDIKQMALVLDALPDPAFLISRSGRYIAVFGGKDARYYHDGSNLVGHYLHDVLAQDKAQWFLGMIATALTSKTLHIEEYELSSKDVKGLPDLGPEEAIWFEGRIQPLDFHVAGEEVVLWVASNISKRHQLETKLRLQGDTDELTNLLNRRRLEKDLTQHFDNFTQYGTPTSILMLDLDHLKLINDRWGHHEGDKTILVVANTCLAHLRCGDSGYRFGGDEFVIALPGMELQQAFQFAEQLRLNFHQELLILSQDRLTKEGVCPSVSIGVATIEAGDTSYEASLKRADRALYGAKHAGRNSVNLAAC
ncbi:GGDEF domain-containing protein [Shewanella sp. AS1]|uniref:GGDEF domain-containing protein n=1 Tax=Shewanella sp. AS1 TaxID=2907626 RepID=UPI001F3CE1A7|nr:sensor domain-containing diguanylate cyclase [Shewanella sp. AS1]MCE9678217.1 GGDEF domain-containing protein [Shewanella sp. AS1]